MKKVLATTMATLIFGVSVPVNTFALPNNPDGLESSIVKDINLEDYKKKIIDRDPKLLQSQGNEQELPAVMNSNNAPNGKPQGYVTVRFKVDPSKGKLQIGGNDVNKSELIYYVNPKAEVPLNEVSSVTALVTNNEKYKLDENKAWTIAPASYENDTLVKEDVTLTANIKDLSNQNSKQERTIAERITKNGLYAADISLWMGDTINWKDGVGLDTSVTDPELKKAFNEASFEGDGRNSNNQRTSGEEGKIKVTFSDNSFIEVEGQKIYVFPHVTASTYDKAPKDAIITNFFLGEGTKVVEGSKVTEGDSDHPTVYKTYKVKPGTDLSKYNLPTNQNVFDNISAKPLDDSYSNVAWEPNNFVVRNNNKVFTAKATKRYKVTFEFQGLDLDTSKDIDAETLVKALRDKEPEEAWVEKGKSFNPTKPENFTEILKDDGGQVTKVYEWTFAGWNPTGIPSASKDEKLIGTWKRSQAKSAEAEVEKISELDKTIKGQGQVGAKIKITFEDKTSLETTVGPNKKWEVKINKNLMKNEKISITQMEKGKKESAKKEVIVSEKAKENKKPDTRPMPNPEVKPDKKPLPKPGTNQKEKNKQNKKENNYFGLRFKNHTTKATKVKTQVENKNINKKQREEAGYIIDVMSGNYQVIKDGVRQNRKMDVMPQIKNDRLMLPLRNVAEMIGATVEWNPQTRTAIFTNKGLIAKIQIDGNEIVLSNGKVIKMDSKPLNINGRILLPISNVANVFGLTNGNTKDGIDQNIEWDGDNKTVEINLNK